MNDIIDVIVSLFTFLMNTTVLNVPLLVWALAPALIALALSILGKRGKSNEK